MSDLVQFNATPAKWKKEWKMWKKPIDVNKIIMGQDPSGGNPYHKNLSTEYFFAPNGVLISCREHGANLQIKNAHLYFQGV